MEPRKISLEKSLALSKRAHQIIPAGCHTYSKGDDQFPENAPRFIERGKGSHVWDVDGNEFVDWGMGLRTVVLGHCYEPVLQAVRKQFELGSNFTRPSPIEVEAAELMLNNIKGMDMVKFGKNGSDATYAAVRLARAYTKRDYIAMCSDTGFYCIGDWFIGKTECDSGVPIQEKIFSLMFDYNNIESLKKLFEEHKDEIACVIMEAAFLRAPEGNFLEKVKKLCHDNGALLIFDEMITGFRFHLGGAQAYFNVTPDLCTFGKGMANGFSVSAIMGKKEIMELGGTEHKKERVFLLSLTHGGETHSLAAAISTINELREKNAIRHIWEIGSMIQEGINSMSREHGIVDNVSCTGFPCDLVLSTKEKGANSLQLRTLFLQEMISRGILSPWFTPSFSHTEEDVRKTLEAADDSLKICKRALDEGFGSYLKSKVVKPVFRRYN